MDHVGSLIPGNACAHDEMCIRDSFDTVPVEIEEAARMDGASDAGVVRRIVLPLARPSLIVTALMVLIYVWNEYIYATTFMTGEANYTPVSYTNLAVYKRQGQRCAGGGT